MRKAQEFKLVMDSCWPRGITEDEEVHLEPDQGYFNIFQMKKQSEQQAGRAPCKKDLDDNQQRAWVPRKSRRTEELASLRNFTWFYSLI